MSVYIIFIVEMEKCGLENKFGCKEFIFREASVLEYMAIFLPKSPTLDQSRH